MCPRGEVSQPAGLAKATGFYSRLFPPPTKPLTRSDEEKLVRLGQSMRYATEREGILTPRAGFTYFGQFIGHDLTHDQTPLAGPYLSAERTPNYRSPHLNLEQVYGGGPQDSPHLYEGEAEAEVFKIGTTTGSGYSRDLSIESGKFQIADNRNLDNLILRQLHVVFLKFHNAAVQQLSSKPPAISGVKKLGSGTIFERARRLVQWHYQWIVRYDFLPRVLHHNIWLNDNRPISSRPGSTAGFSIPIEFSLAAFRFGHSMVRSTYALNSRHPRIGIAELMELGQHSSPLSDDFVIEWGRFFDGLPRSGPVESSAHLDTSLAAPLHGLSEQTLRLGSLTERSDSFTSLPIRTLLRGARSWLPSGQDVAQSLVKNGRLKQEYALTVEQLTQRDTFNRSGKVLRETGLQDNTPLFYYLLKEAELLGLGRTLGPMASQIVAQVILDALQFDPEGYLSAVGPNWELPLWQFSNGTRRKVNSLIGIIRLVGDDRLLAGREIK
jgi:hypothetical protein